MTTNGTTIAKQRAVLRDVDLTLMSVALDLDSLEAAALVGRGRAEVRAAERLLGAAARECCDPPAHCAPMEALANVAGLAQLVGPAIRAGIRG